MILIRDADETKDWIEEKEIALNSTDFGHDLATVQRLQRKHEGLERDLAAIGEKVKDLDDTAQRLMMTHPDQEQSIYEHQREINDLWSGLAHKAEARKAKLLDSYDLQRFLSDFRLVSVTYLCSFRKISVWSIRQGLQEKLPVFKGWRQWR